MKTKTRRVLIVIAGILVLCLVGAVIRWNRASIALPVGAGRTAKLLCSNVFVSGRTPEDVLEEELADMSGYINTDVDYEQQEVTASLGLFKRRAVYREGLGCTDQDALEFPRRALFDPVGTNSAVFEPDASGTFVGSSFVQATARDYARFGLLYLQDGLWQGQRILHEGWVDYSTTPTPNAPQGQYGAQWWLNAGTATDESDRIWPNLPPDIFWASGHDGQFVVVVPSHDLVLIRLGFTPDEEAWDLGTYIGDVLEAVPVTG